MRETTWMVELKMMTPSTKDTKVAYFSMEIALESDLPTYSGGLGVLAGDTLRSAADLELPMVAATLTYSTGYFYQMIDPSGYQTERPIHWEFASELKQAKEVITLPIEDKTFKVKAWEYDVIGTSGHVIKVFLLDSDVEGNEPWQRNFTHVLYDTTPYQRAVAEMILGIGGVKLLRRLGYDGIETYHMNEGHASMLTLELLDQFGGDLEEVRRRCVFTTHTPVPAGHDQFEYEIIDKIFWGRQPPNLRELAGKDKFNTTTLAINMSRYVNAVSRKHAEVSRQMFPGREIDHVTNGVHAAFWVCKPMKKLFDKAMPGWHLHPSFLNMANEIDDEDLWTAHLKAKKELVDYEKSHSWILLDKRLLTVGFARRITNYKRPTLLFHDLERLAQVAKKKVQFVFAGKSHPRDEGAKQHIRRIHEHGEYLWDSYRVRVVFLENYDMDLAHILVSGVDLWLNNPTRYLEASGTSGMKAALNGVPNFSVLDGWWIEGYEMDPLAGWAIGPAPDEPDAHVNDDARDANDIYSKLEEEIIPTFRYRRDEWVKRMKHSIKLGAYFNTHRMVYEYVAKSYQLERQPRWRSIALQ
ncbi:MAG: alpha-glucan family phosphorylase [Promethearchaeota archaeon]